MNQETPRLSAGRWADQHSNLTVWRRALEKRNARGRLLRNPAFQELGVKQGSKVHLVGAPPGHRKLLAPLPEGVEFVPRLSERTNLVHFFSTRTAQLKKALPAIRKKMKADAVVWVSWPKKAAHVATDLTEDAVRDLALPLGSVDVKVCAIDDVWS